MNYMNKSILITGVAGSGKSSVCRELNNLGYKAYDIEGIDGLFAMVDKKTGIVAKNYDNDNLESVKQHDWICDKKKLQQLIENNTNGIVFCCGIASNLDNLLHLFDIIFLLKVSSKIIRKRLNTRKSKEYGNTTEVQEQIISWKDWWETHIIEKGAISINANLNIQKVTRDILGRCKSLK